MDFFNETLVYLMYPFVILQRAFLHFTKINLVSKKKRNLLNFEIIKTSFFFFIQNLSRSLIKVSQFEICKMRIMQEKRKKIIITKKLKKLHLNKIIRKNNNVIISLTVRI